jgi:hypothetical protein
MNKEFGPEYASVADASFIVKYRASCHCKAVQIEVCADPVGEVPLKVVLSASEIRLWNFRILPSLIGILNPIFYFL